MSGTALFHDVAAQVRADSTVLAHGAFNKFNTNNSVVYCDVYAVQKSAPFGASFLHFTQSRNSIGRPLYFATLLCNRSSKHFFRNCSGGVPNCEGILQQPTSCSAPQAAQSVCAFSTFCSIY